MKHATATFAGSAASPDGFPADGLPELAFLGRSNVGKSSLLNALAGTRGLARVSSAPGRTRLVVFFRVAGLPRLGGAGRGDLYLVDLPGYGYAKAPRQVREGFERLAVSYLRGRAPLRLCVFIVDARHQPNQRDFILRDWLETERLPYLIAANKTDALPRGQVARQLQALSRGIGRGAQAVLGVSAECGDGVPQLWQHLRAAAFAAAPGPLPPGGDEHAPILGTAGDHGR